jgi:hypothetical protein
MGTNASREARCEAMSDPTIVPPPPPGSASGQGQGGVGGAPPPPTAEQPYVSEKYKNNPGTFEDVHKKAKGKRSRIIGQSR